MPWMSIITWLLTFLMSKASGASSGKAALLATGAGLATYYLADPSNKDNVLGLSFGADKATPGDANVVKDGVTAPDVSKLGSFGSTAVSQVGETLRSWGPTGTVGVIAGAAAATSIDWKKWFPWIAGGLGLYLLTR